MVTAARPSRLVRIDQPSIICVRSPHACGVREVAEALDRAEDAAARGRRNETLHLHLACRLDEDAAGAERDAGREHDDGDRRRADERERDGHGDTGGDEPRPQPSLTDRAEHYAGEQSACCDGSHEQTGSGLSHSELVDREGHDEHFARPRDGERQCRYKRDRAHVTSGDIACASGGLGECVPESACGVQLNEICGVDPHSACRDEGAEGERR